MRLAVVCLLAASCRNIEREGHGHAVGSAPPFVLVERDGTATRLVAVDESAARVGLITHQDGQGSIDMFPALSPDGRFVVFASTRGRTGGNDLSLWVTRSDGSGEPQRLTADATIDNWPAWSPDGKTIVFARAQGNQIDLWTVPVMIQGDKLGAGPPVQLTHTDESEIEPSWSPDGQTIACSTTANAVDYVLSLVRFPSGSVRDVTGGPSDHSPWYSADGKGLYFSGQADARDDQDILFYDLASKQRRVVVDDANGDQDSPRLAGGWLFAVSKFRTQGAVMQQLIVFTQRGAPASWQALVDLQRPVSRLGVAIMPGKLDDKVLLQAPTHDAALRKLLGVHP